VTGCNRERGLAALDPQARGRGAFTLIELLVVIAVVALLVSILVPSLKRARELARIAVCGTHVRGISNAGHLYAQEWDDHLPGGGGGDPLGPTIHYNQGKVQEFIREYCAWSAEGRGLMECPSSGIRNYTGWPGASKCIDYWLAGFAPPTYNPHQIVYDHPRLSAVATPGSNGPKVFVMDWAYAVRIPDHRYWLYDYATGHLPGSPQGGNVGSPDGSTAWIGFDDWYFRDNYLSHFVAVPRGYYVQRWGFGSVETPADPPGLLFLVEVRDGLVQYVNDNAGAARAMYGY